LRIEVGHAERVLGDDLVSMHDRKDATGLLGARELKFKPIANVVRRKLQPWFHAFTKTRAIMRL